METKKRKGYKHLYILSMAKRENKVHHPIHFCIYVHSILFICMQNNHKARAQRDANKGDKKKKKRETCTLWSILTFNPLMKIDCLSV